MVIGTIDNISNEGFGDPSTPGNSLIGTNTLLQFGLAFEAEYHLLNDQLGIYFNAGYASGDADSEGLTPASSRRGLGFQSPIAGESIDRNLTAFAFHPNYRVDLIFWRTMMRGIGSAYYFRPGLSYDFIRNSFGQLLGARADVVWSRASQPIQTWGNGPDLGVEIDAQVYYRSEDGPGLPRWLLRLAAVRHLLPPRRPRALAVRPRGGPSLGDSVARRAERPDPAPDPRRPVLSSEPS